jgi:arsenate reductase
MSTTPYKLLFLCTGNSARSILAEYITKHFYSNLFEAVSAGSDPKGEPHPMGLTILREDFAIDCSDARSKSWEEFKDVHFDFVITLCDNAKESCPVWPGQPLLSHWGMEDPSDAPAEEQRRAFGRTAQVLKHRMELLASLPISKLDRLKLEAETHQIGSSTPESLPGQ